MSWASCFYTPGVSRIIQKSFGFDLLFFWASESAVVNRACSLDPSGFHPDATVLRPVSVFQQTMDQRRHPLDRCSKMMLHPDPCAVHGRQASPLEKSLNSSQPFLKTSGASKSLSSPCTCARCYTHNKIAVRTVLKPRGVIKGCVVNPLFQVFKGGR